MESRTGIDCQTDQAGSPVPVMIELKGLQHSEPTSPNWLFWTSRSLRKRRLQLIPLALLIAVGATIPGFLVTLGLLLAAVAVMLGAFVLLVQLPVGYLARCWRDIRRSRASQLARLGRESSSGI